MPLYDGNTKIERIVVTDTAGMPTEIEQANFGAVAIFPDSVGLPLLTGFNIVPSSASGTASTTLTATVFGDSGATYNITGTGAPTATRAIGEVQDSDIFTFTLPARGTGAGAVTHTYRVTNVGDPANTFTDTVAQGAGPVPTPVDATATWVSGSQSFSPSTGSIGDSFTVSFSASIRVTGLARNGGSNNPFFWSGSGNSRTYSPSSTGRFNFGTATSVGQILTASGSVNVSTMGGRFVSGFFAGFNRITGAPGVIRYP